MGSWLKAARSKVKDDVWSMFMAVGDRKEMILICFGVKLSFPNLLME